MQATITYLLTEQAQRAQMAATGQPVSRKQTVNVEVAPEDLGLLHISDDGMPSLDVSVRAGYTSHGPSLRAAGWEQLPGTPADLAAPAFFIDVLADLKRGSAILSERNAAAAAILVENGEYNRAQADLAYQEFLRNPNARLDPHNNIRGVGVRSPADWWPHQHDAWTAEIRRRNDADATEKKTAAAAIEQAKLAAIDAFIASTSDTLMIQQHTDGLLSRRDAIAMMAKSALDAANLPAECPDSVVCGNSDCPCKDHIVEVIPIEVYARWKSIGPLPENATITFHAVRNCLRDDDGDYPPSAPENAGPLEYQAVITIPSGPFQFVRRIKV